MQIPPPPPRPLASNFVMRLLLIDAWAIATFVILLLGLPFVLLELGLALVSVTAPIGTMFLGIGLLFIMGGVALLFWRYQKAAQKARAYHTGEAVEGKFVQLEKIMYIRALNRRPWKIQYQFHVDGQMVTGEARTWAQPGDALQPGQHAYVLYLPQEPEANALYPNP